MASIRKSLLSIHILLSIAHTEQIIYVEGLWDARNNSLHRDGKYSEVNYKGFIRRNKFWDGPEEWFGNALEVGEKYIAGLLLDYLFECCCLCGVSLGSCSKIL